MTNNRESNLRRSKKLAQPVNPLGEVQKTKKAKKVKRMTPKEFFQKCREQKALLWMTVPFLIWLFIFKYFPLVGWTMAFQNFRPALPMFEQEWVDRKSTRLNSSHVSISYAVYCLQIITNTEGS